VPAGGERAFNIGRPRVTDMDANRRIGLAKLLERQLEDARVGLCHPDPLRVDDHIEQRRQADLGEQIGDPAFGVRYRRDPHVTTAEVSYEIDHGLDRPPPQVLGRLLLVEPSHGGLSVWTHTGPGQEGVHERMPGVLGTLLRQRVVGTPRSGRGRPKCLCLDEDPAFGEPADQEVKVKVNQGLTHVERDDRRRHGHLYLVCEGYTRTVSPDGQSTSQAVPGVVVVWTGAQPTVQVFRVGANGVVIGRELLQTTTDDRISRQHARIMWKDRRFVVTDLGSRNGTYAGGHALVDREVTVTPPSVVRCGRTVSVLIEDVRRFEGASIETRHDAIVGASTYPLWMQMEQAATAGNNLLIIGEAGVGKGRMARGYARVRGRPEAVFNPTIQAVPLERIAAPQVETLILEQVGKFRGPDTQTLTKLLDTRPNLRIVTTSSMPLEHLGLPPEIVQRLSRATVILPPLRDRPDEMAFLVHDAVRSSEPGIQIHSTLIEACLLRPWPGNSRELVSEVSRTAHTVASQGKNNVRGEDLDNDAGHLMVGAPTLNAAATPTAVGKQRRKRPSSRPNSRD